MYSDQTFIGESPEKVTSVDLKEEHMQFLCTNQFFRFSPSRREQ